MGSIGKRIHIGKGNELQIIIDAFATFFSGIFFGLALLIAFGVFGGMTKRLIQGSYEASLIGTVVMLIAFLVVSLLALYAFLWTAFGREIIKIKGMELVVRKDILGLGKTRKFNNIDSASLNVVPYQNSYWSTSLQELMGFGKGSVEFKNNGKTESIGLCLDEQDASKLAEMLKNELS